MESKRLEISGLKIEDGKVTIEDLKAMRKEGIDELVKKVVLEDDLTQKAFYVCIIWQLAALCEIYPASMHNLYRARGRREIGGFTVPAINLRTLTYEAACAVFKVAKKINAAAFVFEIARSEMGYTAQRPLEYTAVCLAAAIKEGHQGPVFIQGDHFQLKLKDFEENKDKALKDIKKLIKESINAGFYNIDIDASTLVDLSKTSLLEQQYNNFWVSAELTKFIRKEEPQGVTISIGGEIGEVGGKNSTPEDLNAFMQGYLKELGDAYEGISKISIQTGTTHGGVVLPDGSIKEVKVDFDTLEDLSELARKKYEMAGAVQHGASTLPRDAFHKFSEAETAEIHLATQFQNIAYENIPQDLRSKIYSWLKDNYKSDWKEGQTEEQFLYKTRKQALGPFKKEIASLPDTLKVKISEKLEAEFEFLFRKLKIEDSRDIAERYLEFIEVKKSPSDLLPQEIVSAHFDGAD